MTNNQKRLFVGNLPPNISEQEVKNEFSCYGPVRKVEVKQKKGTDSADTQSTFAFVTIEIDDRSVNQCLQEFKSQQFRGRYLQVTVARENFLEKLKREREEAAKNAPHKVVENNVNESEKINVKLPTFSSKKSSSESSSSSSSDESSDDEEPNKTNQNGLKKVKSSSSDSSDSDQEEGNLILRKKSKIFLQNGKIKIDHNVAGGKAIHVIERNATKPPKKEFDEKSKKADQKRIESLKKMKNSYNEQKLAIKNALAGVDATKKNNKIVFGDDDDDIGAQPKDKQKVKLQKEVAKSGKKPTLFEDDENEESNENYEKDFQIKEQFQGRKGEKLMQLQSRFHNDTRFNMNANFIDDKDGSDGDEYSHKNDEHKSRNGKTSHDNDDNEDDERKWQYDILESVMGKKIRQDVPPKDAKKKAPPSMLRFDPTRAEHTKFIEPAKKRPKKSESKMDEAKRRRIQEEEENEALPPVSMDQFYEVRGDLKKSMGTGGFSLLSMFGRATDTDKITGTHQPYEEKLIAKTHAKFIADLNPFKYDSSGDEADIDRAGKVQSTKVTNDVSKDIKSGAIWHETFFILKPNDERLTDGIAFFISDEQPEQHDINDETKKQELRNIVKRKIKKSIKNALPRHVKPNKRFKRFTKNL